MITLYHNPKCSKSRETLAILQAAGVAVTVVEYLNTPLTAQTIERLIRESGISVRQAMRTDVATYRQFVAEKALSDEQLIALMATYPELLNRPFASGQKGSRFCRPPTLVNELL